MSRSALRLGTILAGAIVLSLLAGCSDDKPSTQARPRPIISPWRTDGDVDARLTLASAGSQVTTTGWFMCNVTDKWTMRVEVKQGTTLGAGEGANGTCTGAKDKWQVTAVPTAVAFVPGPAEVCVFATKDPPNDQFKWCNDVQFVAA